MAIDGLQCTRRSAAMFCPSSPQSSLIWPWLSGRKRAGSFCNSCIHSQWECYRFTLLSSESVRKRIAGKMSLQRDEDSELQQSLTQSTHSECFKIQSSQSIKVSEFNELPVIRGVRNSDSNSGSREIPIPVPKFSKFQLRIALLVMKIQTTNKRRQRAIRRCLIMATVQVILNAPYYTLQLLDEVYRLRYSNLFFRDKLKEILVNSISNIISIQMHFSI